MLLNWLFSFLLFLLLFDGDYDDGGVGDDDDNDHDDKYWCLFKQPKSLTATEMFVT